MDDEKISVVLLAEVELMRQELVKLKQMVGLIGQLVYLGAEDSTTSTMEEGDGTQLESIFDVFYEQEEV
jgi:hypothetical protein